VTVAAIDGFLPDASPDHGEPGAMKSYREASPDEPSAVLLLSVTTETLQALGGQSAARRG
jgi:hypothetical protein